MFSWPAQPEHRGLFITGTDTGVGKTAVVCAIADALAARARTGAPAGGRPGVCKPFATGCRRCRAGWTGEDIEALRVAAGIGVGDAAALARLCPQAFELPASPAAAAEHERREVDFAAVADALLETDRVRDLLLVEGIGGPKVPLDPRQPRYTVAEFASDLGFPVLLVARAGLGTLSHTAMAVETLQTAGCRVVGVVLNDADDVAGEDPTFAGNPAWIERMTGIKVLARLPRAQAWAPGEATPPALLQRIAAVPWAQLAGAVPRVSEAVAW